jgi:hypothetical protein
MKVSNSSSFGISLKEFININTNNSKTIDNDKYYKNKDPYKILSEKIDSTKTKTPKLITTIDNINKQQRKKYEFKIPNMKLPLIKTRQLLTEADLIVNKGKKLEGLTPVYIPINIKVKKSTEINLNNNLIKKIIEKRQEIKNNEKKYIDEINKRNKEYNKQYKNYLNLVELGQKKQKEEDDIYIKLKNELKIKENIYNNETEKNQLLLLNIKKVINDILIFKKYGQFINKFFGQKFIFDQLKDFDGKNYNKMVKEIINIYENNKEDDKFYEMLESQGLYYFFIKWSNMESKIRNELDKNNEINEELIDLKINMNNDIDNLNIKKEDTNKEKLLYNKNKKEELLMVKGFKEYYKIDDIKMYLNYIIELGNLISNIYKEIPFSYNNKNINNNEDIIEESLYICKEVIKCLEIKEEIINEYSDKINNIFNNGNKDDIKLLENIINKRRKLNMRVKQNELNKIKENSKRKNVFKTLDTQKIIIKGRKIFEKYPLFKDINKKKDLKKPANENLLLDYQDYICYSEDED